MAPSRTVGFARTRANTSDNMTASADREPVLFSCVPEVPRVLPSKLLFAARHLWPSLTAVHLALRRR